MASATRKKQRLQHWLYINDTELTLIESGTSRDGLPFLKIVNSLRCDAPLNHAASHAKWVADQVGRSLNIILSFNQYQLLLTDVPDVPPEELDDAIELKAADLISYDLDDATLDTIHLPAEAYRGRMRMAFIVACRKAPLQVWAQTLLLQGVKVNTIDVEITQLRNLALNKRNFNESGILHLTDNNSRLLLSYQDEMVLTRSFGIGLSSLVTETTVSDGELELTVPEENSTDIQIDSLVLEIRRSFDYYESQLGLGAIAEIQFLCDRRHQTLAEKLARKLGVRLVMSLPEDSMHIELSQPEQDPVDYYNIAGIAFRETLS